MRHRTEVNHAWIVLGMLVITWAGIVVGVMELATR